MSKVLAARFGVHHDGYTLNCWVCCFCYGFNTLAKFAELVRKYKTGIPQRDFLIYRLSVACQSAFAVNAVEEWLRSDDAHRGLAAVVFLDMCTVVQEHTVQSMHTVIALKPHDLDRLPCLQRKVLAFP